MKKVILLVLLMPCPAFGQIVENFESGNLNNWLQSTPGHWKADQSEAITGSYSLHHVFDNLQAGTDITGLPVMNLHPSQGDTRWSFTIRHGSDPSSSNNWAVFLMSDRETAGITVPENTKGFAIGVNITGSDDTLRLVEMNGSIVKNVISSGINWQNDIGISNPVKISVIRSKDGIWHVSVCRLNGIMIGEAAGSDSKLFSISSLIVFYRYSSTRDRLLWVDDISLDGPFYTDNEPPAISVCNPSGTNSVEIVFSEDPSEEFMLSANISLNSEGYRPEHIIKKSPATYIIDFACRLKNKAVNKLSIQKICDNSGNCSENLQVSFTPVWAEAGDVVISEIMADPLPEVNLPGKEYLEIRNRTEFSFNLSGWKFITSGNLSYPFSEKIIGPHQILIISAASDTLQFRKYGMVYGLKQFPSLTDEGKAVCLTDSTGNLIHGVEYSSGWYRDELKSGGGWSLEMIDPQFPFSGCENWAASVSRNGGTPGRINSIEKSNPDIFFRGLVNVFADDSMNIRLEFSEPVFTLSGNKKQITIGGKELTGLYPVDHMLCTFIAKLAEPLNRGAIYNLEVSPDVSDFAGNRIQVNSYYFGMSEIAATGDIMFNELLFNPSPGDPDYIELINCSGKIIDASRLQLVSLNSDTGDPSSFYPVSYEKRCILPGSYYAITEDRNRISAKYFSSLPENIFETGALPSMADDKGHLVLFNRQLDMIDEVIYSEKMHYSLLSDFEGIALEKSGSALQSTEPSNWHSASESCGWGTPGAPNSQFIPAVTGNDILTFSSTSISPDNDGNEDFLKMDFILTGNMNTLSATVYDENGHFFRKIASNFLAGPGTSLTWDGTAEDGTLASTGIYIIFITLFDDTGKTKSWKKICTVLR